MPQYMLLIYPPADSSPREDRLPLWHAFNEAVRTDGVYVTSGRLQTLESATTVRVRDGESLVSDGPFAETKEYLAGFYLLECEDLDGALAYAARMPLDESGAVEVRPMMFPVGTSTSEMRTQAEA